MKKIFSLLILLSSLSLMSKENLNYMESQIMRLPSKHEGIHNFLPFKKNDHGERDFKFSSFIFTNTNLKKVYENYTSKNDELILKTANDSYGKPLQSLNKFSASIFVDNFTQSFSINAGLVMLLTNPVLPEVSGFAMVDFSSTSSLGFYSDDNKFRITPSLTLSRRKSVKETLPVSTVLLSSQELQLNNESWYTTLTSSLSSSYKFDSFILNSALNALPIKEDKYSYWEGLLGVETYNLMSENGRRYLETLSFYAHYSPLYGGEYDVKRTYMVGSEVGLSKYMNINLYVTDKLFVNFIGKLMLENSHYEFFYLKNSYDDFYFQETRSFGVTTSHYF